ncbi:MAG: hypothetical protein II916_08050 [Oscillospiraceae bacterium]|nr:hypothetical protein [Oscillospiraceae bacterium]
MAYYNRETGSTFGWLLTVLFSLLTLTEIFFRYLFPERSLADFPVLILVIGTIILWGGAFLLSLVIARWFASQQLRAEQDSGVKWLLWLVLEYGAMAAMNGACVWIWHIMWG